MAIAGGLLRLVLITCYAIAFICAAIIMGAFAWVSNSAFHRTTPNLPILTNLYSSPQPSSAHETSPH